MLTGSIQIVRVLIVGTIALSTYFPRSLGQSIDQTERLLESLTSAYDTRVRPVRDQNHPISISTSFVIRSVQSFDDITGIVNFHSLMRLSWQDARMQWDPKQYSNLEEFVIPTDEIWCPNFVMLNSPSNLNQPAMNMYLARIKYTGHVSVTSIDTLQAICSVDVSNFPYDTQSCDISIVPWGYESKEVAFVNQNDSIIDTEGSNIVNSAWLIEESSLTLTDTKGVSTMTIYLSITRRHLYTVVNIIIPMYTLAVLNTWVFILPPESGERTSYSITVLLSFVVYMGILSDNVPKGSEPLSQLSIYLIMMIFYSVSILFWTIISLRVYNNVGKRPVPYRWKFLTHYARFRHCNIRRKRNNVGVDHENPNTTSMDTKGEMENEKGNVSDDTILTTMNFGSTTRNMEWEGITWTDVGETMDIYVILCHSGWIIYMVVILCQLSQII